MKAARSHIHKVIVKTLKESGFYNDVRGTWKREDFLVELAGLKKAAQHMSD